MNRKYGKILRRVNHVLLHIWVENTIEVVFVQVICDFRKNHVIKCKRGIGLHCNEGNDFIFADFEYHVQLLPVFTVPKFDVVHIYDHFNKPNQTEVFFLFQLNLSMTRLSTDLARLQIYERLAWAVSVANPLSFQFYYHYLPWRWSSRMSSSTQVSLGMKFMSRESDTKASLHGHRADDTGSRLQSQHSTCT